MKNPLYILLLVFLISCSADKPSERLAQQCDCVQQVSYYNYNPDGTTTLTDYTEIPVTLDCSQNNITVTEDIQISDSTLKRVTKTVCD